MTWQHLKTFLWVRGRILRNQAKRNSFDSLLLQGALIVIPGIAGVVMFVAFFGVGLFVLQDVSPAVLMLVWDGLLGAFLLFWMIGLLTELQRSELLSIEKFLRLPVPPRSVFLINYLGSIVLTPCMVVFLPAMVGLATGLVISRGSLMLGLFPLILAFIVLVTAITYQFQGWLAALMVNKRRRRNIIAVSTVGFVLVLQLPYLVGLFAESRSEPPSAEIADMREERRALRIQIAALTQAADEEESGEAERIAVLASLRTYRGRVEVLTQSIDALSEVLAPFAVGDVTYPLARKGAYATEQVAGAISGRNLLHRNILTSQHQQRTAQAPYPPRHGRSDGPALVLRGPKRLAPPTRDRGPRLSPSGEPHAAGPARPPAAPTHRRPAPPARRTRPSPGPRRPAEEVVTIVTPDRGPAGQDTP